MLCPNCKTTKLALSTRSNVEIDYCPDCRGVWLDRGELDKLIELASLNMVPQSAQPNVPQPQQYQAPQPMPQYQQTPQYHSGGYPQPNNQGYHQSDKHNPHYKHKKKEGWFGEMFDFD